MFVATKSFEEILAEIRALPVADRLKVIERVAHEVAENTPAPSGVAQRVPVPNLFGLMEDFLVQRREGAEKVGAGRKQRLNVEAHAASGPDVHRHDGGRSDLGARAAEEADPSPQLRQPASEIDDRPLGAAIAVYRESVGKEEGHMHGAIS